EMLLNLYLTKYFSSQPNNQELKELFDVIVGYLKKNPDECMKILELIRSNKIPEKGSGILFLMLEKAGHRKVQETLLSILENSSAFTRLSQVRAAGALIGIPHIQADLFDRMIALEQSGNISEIDGRNSLMLTIAGLGRSAHNPAIRAKAENYIRSKLMEAQNVSDISNAVLLDAVANLGNPNLLPMLERFIFEAKHEAVKHHAILALTHMPEKDANPLIMKILNGKDIYNIGSAVEVLKKREAFNQTKTIDLEINKKLVELLPTTTNSFDVRKNIAEYLTINKENHEMLLKIADNKKEHFEIRKVIYQNIPVSEPKIERVQPGQMRKKKGRAY
ncbi:MAG TPA: hypothetical protein PLJ38_05385, partial [bacterium]|nr:hypothetical protein [bacterium]